MNKKLKAELTDQQLAKILPCIVYVAEFIHNEGGERKDMAVLRWFHNNEHVLQSERKLLVTAANYQLAERK